MLINILSYGPPFSHHHHETAFQAAQATSQHRQDRLAGGLGLLIYGALWLRAWNVHSRMFMLTAMPALVLRFLVPLLCPGPACARGGVRAFARCRVRAVVVLRLIGGLTVGLLDPAFFVGPPFLGDTPAGNLSALVHCTLVPDTLLGAVGFRLPLLVHCAVQTVLLAAYLWVLPAACAGHPLLLQPGLMALYARAAGVLGAVGRAFSPAGAAWVTAMAQNNASWVPPPVFEAPLPSSPCNCVAVNATLAVLGYFISCFLVGLAELAARAAYVVDRQHARGWTFEERRRYLVFDGLAAWLRLCFLLPPLASGVWHVVLVGTRRVGSC